jgi:hypothetical protein
MLNATVRFARCVGPIGAVPVEAKKANHMERLCRLGVASIPPLRLGRIAWLIVRVHDGGLCTPDRRQPLFLACLRGFVAHRSIISSMSVVGRNASVPRARASRVRAAGATGCNCVLNAIAIASRAERRWRLEAASIPRPPARPDRPAGPRSVPMNTAVW